MTVKKKILVLLLVISFFFVLLVGCAENGNKLEQGEDRTLKLGVLSLEDILPMLVANEKGYFAKEKLKVELIPFQSAVESQTALQSGRIDGMMTDLIVAALLKDTGTDLKVTSVTLEATGENRRFAILVSPKSKITSLMELQGKPLGISFNSVIEFVSDGILKDGGVEPTGVEKTSIPKIPVRLEMLLNGKIEAATLPDPLAEFAELQGCRSIADDLGKNISQAVLVMTNKSLNTKKEHLIDFYRAYKKAVIEINQDPQEFKDLLIPKISIPEAMIEQYKVPEFPNLKLPSQEEVAQVLDWLWEKELIKERFVYEDFVEKGLY